MNDNARTKAFFVIKKVIMDGAFLNIALKDMRNNDPKEIAFITNLVNTALENYRQIEYIINEFSVSKRLHNSIKCILTLAICEIEFLNTAEAIAANEYVEVCKSIGKEKLAGFVNAVLREYSKERHSIKYPDEKEEFVEYLKIFSGYPEWLICEIIQQYGNDFAKNFLLYENPKKGYSFVRLNILMDQKESILEEIKSNNLNFQADLSIDDGGFIKNLTSISKQEVFNKGKIAIQGKASILSVKLGNPKPDTRVLDACAAPGGKTASIAALMNNTGNIDAFDIHEHRVELIRRNMERLGVTNVHAIQKDATEFDLQYKELYDLVYVDLPCSSLGLAYKKADIKLFKTKNDIDELVKLQKSILNIVKSYVKKGGILMVITCSITKDESDLSWFFKRNKDYVECELDMPKGIDYIKAEHGIHLFPHISNTDGFYICKIMRK